VCRGWQGIICRKTAWEKNFESQKESKRFKRFIRFKKSQRKSKTLKELARARKNQCKSKLIF
jgi:hypothetical protein